MKVFETTEGFGGGDGRGAGTGLNIVNKDDTHSAGSTLNLYEPKGCFAHADCAYGGGADKAGNGSAKLSGGTALNY